MHTTTIGPEDGRAFTHAFHGIDSRGNHYAKPFRGTVDEARAEYERLQQIGSADHEARACCIHTPPAEIQEILSRRMGASLEWKKKAGMQKTDIGWTVFPSLNATLVQRALLGGL
ncbi:MAG: hypothetical protein EHJ95_00265 [Methanobacteriota archaeon]|nr:MAG: hypothetical protein EHJ95_00265 [Euryarchaeota archaeon]